MNFWQFKISTKIWDNDFGNEFKNLDIGSTYSQSIGKNAKNKPTNNINDIVFIYNTKKNANQKYPQGIYLICKIIENLNENYEIILEVICDLRDNPIKPENLGFETVMNKINSLSQNGTYYKFEADDNPQKLYDLITSDEINNILPEELNQEDLKTLTEGAKKEITVNAYERSSEARQKCIEKYGTNCQVCGFDFEKIYGEIGKDFIHVHHLTEISCIAENYEVNPIKDLRPVCPNCHAMLHKNKPAYSIEELIKIIEKQMIKIVEIKYINENFGSANNAMAHIGAKNALQKKYQELILNENNIDNIIETIKNNYNNELYFDFEIYLTINDKQYIIDSKFNLQ